MLGINLFYWQSSKYLFQVCVAVLLCRILCWPLQRAVIPSSTTKAKLAYLTFRADRYHDMVSPARIVPATNQSCKRRRGSVISLVLLAPLSRSDGCILSQSSPFEFKVHWCIYLRFLLQFSIEGNHHGVSHVIKWSLEPLDVWWLFIEVGITESKYLTCLTVAFRHYLVTPVQPWFYLSITNCTFFCQLRRSLIASIASKVLCWNIGKARFERKFLSCLASMASS
jgi:hypothetical protein